MEYSVLKRNIRRMEDELAISGLAVLALGAWSSIKLCVSIFLGYGEVTQQFGGEVPVWLITEMMIVVAVVAGGLGMLVHLYIGLSARADAFGRKHVPPYVIVSVMLFVVTIISVLLALDLEEAAGGRTQAESVIIDLTLLFALFNLIRSAWKLKRMRRKLATAGSPGDTGQQAEG